jgi:UDP-N-acetylmuramate--alanine ligase
MLKVGVFFGGSSREREVSFAGGRTVIDNLDKRLFEAVPIFVDSQNRFILLDWHFLYKGTIRDFYPAPDLLSGSDFQMYIESLQDQPHLISQSISRIGKQISPEEFSSLFDLAFLALHGPFGEDGNLQGLLEWYEIPYTGSGVFSSALGLSKTIQADLQKGLGLRAVSYKKLYRSELESRFLSDIWQEVKQEIGLPCVVKASSQGSSIGVSIVEHEDEKAFEKAVRKAFFEELIDSAEWQKRSSQEKTNYVRRLADIRDGLGMPLRLEGRLILRPEQLLAVIDQESKIKSELILQSEHPEQVILIEAFIPGKEFSCIVISDELGHPLALPPTEIIKRSQVFDYRAKYLPGISRKVTPIETDEKHIEAIRKACEQLYLAFQFEVYARIDGFLKPDGTIILNDPNTTSGMMPSSFFFHQAAEIGLNPSQFLTYIMHHSLLARRRSGRYSNRLLPVLNQFEQNLKASVSARDERVPVAVIMGGYSAERHISVESGRNVYEKLSSSGKYLPYPIFLSGNADSFELHLLPINVMLKDNADDIREKVHSTQSKHPVVKRIVEQSAGTAQLYRGDFLEYPKRISLAELAEIVDFAFIALHGRPGEDGALQTKLEQFGIPYNGSGVKSSSTTINKYLSNEILAQSGVPVASHLWLTKEQWLTNSQSFYEQAEQALGYPMILKPADDGCSAAVKKIKNREEFKAFASLIFRQTEALTESDASILKLAPQEEFPIKQGLLAERFIDAGGASHFLEITGGFVSEWLNGESRYRFFEPSEVLATGEVLSLEEKFLAGEGQNITPARFDPDPAKRDRIAEKVKKDLEKTARLLSVEGYGRIDAFVRIFPDERVETIIIEINSLPGMTPATCIFHQCALDGLSPFQFIDEIIRYGIQRKAVLSLE